MFSKFVVSSVSAMSIPLSPINLPSTFVVSPELIQNSNTFYSVTARVFDITFWSTFKREISLQF